MSLRTWYSEVQEGQYLANEIVSIIKSKIADEKLGYVAIEALKDELNEQIKNIKKQ